MSALERLARRLIEAVDRVSPEPLELRSDFNEALTELRFELDVRRKTERRAPCPIHLWSEWRDGTCGACQEKAA